LGEFEGLELNWNFTNYEIRCWGRCYKHKVCGDRWFGYFKR